MIERYSQIPIDRIFSDSNKLKLWQETELAVIQAYSEAGLCTKSDFDELSSILLKKPIDVRWWKRRDKVIGHDLNAFLEERIRLLPTKLQPIFHRNITSYDTEEAAFARMLLMALRLVNQAVIRFDAILVDHARIYRYTLMVGRTHGQQGELQTHGKRCLTWLRQLRQAKAALDNAGTTLRYSKISGAVGNYGALHPETEKRALAILGLLPFEGATQIMPRVLYAPLAQSLAQLVQVLDQIAFDIRLNARTPLPLYQEPFGKKQKGSSAMPHKKNTIVTEQLEGMARMAVKYAEGIQANIHTWEERAIEQSCVERVFWPDLFHVVLHSLAKMEKVVSGLIVHRHNMLIEIVMCRGCYATAGAKEVLKDLVAPFGLKAEDAYRIIQLAAFNIFEYPGPKLLLPTSLAMAERQLSELKVEWRLEVTLADHISGAQLRQSSELGASAWKVKQWNRVLRRVFSEERSLLVWKESFLPSEILKHEFHLFETILGSRTEE